MKKLAFFDLDGTLCNGGSLQVEQEVIAAFSKLRENEVLPIIATGRSYYEVKELLAVLQTEHFILSNGCYVRFEGKTIQNAKFSQPEIEAVLTIAENNRLTAGFFNQQGFAITNLSEVVKEHAAYMGLSDVPVSANFYQTNPVNFMNLYLAAEQEEKLRDELNAVADIVRFAPLAIDVLPKNVSKGTAIQKLLDSMAGTQLETYAFGDQNNDLSMFQLVDHGIAMAQGTDELKTSASYVAQTENGVLEGLRHYGLIS
ncbi:HAD family hydrolase [Enterococcus hulanensis]|uniref:Cof-type HAD-IIB family hydrolase n=1 Tax=Enterococcus hulanensis TaxID=2559929 RepID=UPI0010F9DD54|nr:HAD family hydrolase [Enterococcus hulanensis]